MKGMEIKVGDWVFIAGGGCGKVTGIEGDKVAVELDYFCEVLFPREKIVRVARREYEVSFYDSRGYGVETVLAATPEEAAEKASRYTDATSFHVRGCGDYEIRGGRAVRAAKAS